MTYKVQALSVPGTLDQAVALYRDNFKTIFLIALTVYIPVEVIRALVAAANAGPITPFKWGMSTREVLEWYSSLTHARSTGNRYFTWVMILFILPFTNAAVVHLVSNAYMNTPVSTSESLRRSIARLPSLIWANLLFTVALFGCGIGAFIVAGLMIVFLGPFGYFAVLPAVLVFAYIVMRFSLLNSAIMIEEKRGMKALTRSAELMAGNYLEQMLLILILLAPRLLLFLFIISEKFVPMLALRAALQASMEGILITFSACTFVVFYYSCRCKREHFDLSLLADNAGANVSTGSDLDSPPKIIPPGPSSNPSHPL